jgi:hypothetical protein
MPCSCGITGTSFRDPSKRGTDRRSILSPRALAGLWSSELPQPREARVSEEYTELARHHPAACEGTPFCG